MSDEEFSFDSSSPCQFQGHSIQYANGDETPPSTQTSQVSIHNPDGWKALFPPPEEDTESSDDDEFGELMEEALKLHGRTTQVQPTFIVSKPISTSNISTSKTPSPCANLRSSPPIHEVRRANSRSPKDQPFPIVCQVSLPVRPAPPVPSPNRNPNIATDSAHDLLRSGQPRHDGPVKPAPRPRPRSQGCSRGSGTTQASQGVRTPRQSSRISESGTASRPTERKPLSASPKRVQSSSPRTERNRPSTGRSPAKKCTFGHAPQRQATPCTKKTGPPMPPPEWVNRLYIPPPEDSIKKEKSNQKRNQKGPTKTKSQPKAPEDPKTRQKKLQCPADSIWANLHSAGMVRNRKIARMNQQGEDIKKEEEEEEYRKNCTFAPKISDNAKVVYEMEPVQDVVERLTKVLPSRRKLEMREVIEIAERDVREECTFAPKVRKSKYDPEPTKEAFHKRLYKDAQSRQDMKDMFQYLWAGVPTGDILLSLELEEVEGG